MPLTCAFYMNPRGQIIGIRLQAVDRCRFSVVSSSLTVHCTKCFIVDNSSRNVTWFALYRLAQNSVVVSPLSVVLRKSF